MRILIFYIYMRNLNKNISKFFFSGQKNSSNKDFFLTDKMLEKSEILMQQFLTFFYKNNPAQTKF